MSEEMIGKVQAARIMPVVAIEKAEDTEPLMEALIGGGLPAAEITFRTAAAPEAIRIAAKTSALVGAGTVLTVDQAKQAADCGATFLVSPGFGPKVTAWCVENKMPIFPGIATPTDIQQALEFGLEVVKFFPAEAYGGLKTLKALAAPYTMMRFMPTGGIHAGNILDYLAFERVIACGGSWMVKKDLIAAGNFAEIKRLTEEAMAVVKGA